jgi:hypothetical protein
MNVDYSDDNLYIYILLTTRLEVTTYNNSGLCGHGWEVGITSEEGRAARSVSVFFQQHRFISSSSLDFRVQS